MLANIRRCRHSSGHPCSQFPTPIDAVFDCWFPNHIVSPSEMPSSILKHTLKARCSRKWAVPFVLSVSAREPASIQTPTVEVCAHGECSVAIFFVSATTQPEAISKPYRQTIWKGCGLCLHAIFRHWSREPSSQSWYNIGSSARAQSLRKAQC